MKISTEIGSFAKLVGEEKAVYMVAEAGFDAFDFSMLRMDTVTHPLGGSDYLAFARKIKKIGLDNGIFCNQSHAPFPVYREEIRTFLPRAIECTAEAGGKICVIHPNDRKSPEENAEMYLELLPMAKAYGVILATENMWNWDDKTDTALPAACSSPESFVRHMDAVNDPFFTACLDIGHAEMEGLNTSAPEMIRALGSRLGALHIHDNDLHYDCHAVPFTMNIDFDAVVSALKEVGSRGDLTLEAYHHCDKYTADTVYDGVRELAAAAKRLRKMF